MKNDALLDASSRVALSALLHDMGKFSERARIQPVNKEVLEVNKQLYCPHRKAFTDATGRFTHIHAAYTAISMDVIEHHLPDLVGEDMLPFPAWKSPDVADSMINAAAKHHKPETFLQWIVATADRIASGFEREEFEAYNVAEEKTSTGRNHYTARQLTLFEQIHWQQEIEEGKADLKWRHPLKPMSAKQMFPVKVDECECNHNAQAQNEYRQLWDAFTETLKTIPASHRRNWSLWLDHFDSLWAAFTHAIPSATAGNTKPDVSLYDHSRTTAALATALWRYHHDKQLDQNQAIDAMRHRHDWDEKKLLVVMGDFFGIQEFIFAAGGETQRNAAKLLRGRSFHVSLLTECAALKVLESLQLPSTSQVINAAGKFLIVAPNSEATLRKLRLVQQEIDQWFLKHTYGQSGVGLTWESACCNDFLNKRKDREAPFKRLIGRLFHKLEEMKAKRYSLCCEHAPKPVFDSFLDEFDADKGVCAIDGRSPATEKIEPGAGKYVSQLAADQIRIGRWLGHYARVLLTTENPNHHTLKLNLFGYWISFTGDEDATGKFGAWAKERKLRRAWDYALPADMDSTLFSGYARRNINAYIPLFGELNAWDKDRYDGLGNMSKWDAFAPKTFEHIARDDLWVDESGKWKGSDALMVLKGDVDNLGAIFEKGLERPTFAKWASLSRQMNAFFAVYLPMLCQKKYPSTYTVFAGGDDFFLIGPWKSTVKLIREMEQEFSRYVAGNHEIHFSAGLVMIKPGLPVHQLGEMAETALDASKLYEGKNAITLFGETASWKDFEVLWRCFDDIQHIGEKYNLSTGYLYRLQELANMSENLKSDHPNMENAIWQSWFAYRSWRMLERSRGLNNDERKQRMVELSKILKEPIHLFGSKFRVPLFLHLYHERY